ncbi:hypothetical protein Tco_0189539 [Tanacetum coccineum]
MDALALTPCYSAFLITADVLEVYMHQFWDFVYKHDTFYKFKMDKRKRFKLNLEVFRDIFKIFLRVQGQNFDALPSDEEIMSFLRDLGHTREIHSLNDVVSINPLGYIPSEEYGLFSTEEPMGKSKRVKRPAKKTTKAPARGVFIRETPAIPLAKKKEKVGVTREETTSQLYDGVDIRLNEPVDSDKGFVQEEGTDTTMTNVQQGNENPEIIQVIEDAHLTWQTPTLLTVPVSVISDSLPVFSTAIPQSLPYFTHPPQQSTFIPPLTTEATNPLSTFLDFVSIFQFNNRVTTLLAATRYEFTNFLSASLTTRITKQVQNQLPQILPKEVSNFAPPPLTIQKMVKESLKDVVLAKESYPLQSSYEAAATLTEFELKKILIYKIDKSDKSQSKSSGKSVQSEEPEFEVADLDMLQDQEENLGNDDEDPKEKIPQLGQNQSWLMTLASSTEKPSKTFNELMSTPIDFSAFIMNGLKINNLTYEPLLGPAFRLLKGTHSNYAELEYNFEECYKALSEKLDWENPKGDDYPFDLTKPLPLVMRRNSQKVPVNYFFNNDLKYLQGGISTMTYMTSLTKKKSAQYDLPSIEDMVPNIWVPIKVAYDKHALWGISHWREQRRESAYKSLGRWHFRLRNSIKNVHQNLGYSEASRRSSTLSRKLPEEDQRNLDNSTSNVLIPLDSWISGLLVYRFPLSDCFRMDDPNMTMEEYIKLEEEKAHRRGRVFNWKTATYGKIKIDDNLHNLSFVEAEFPAIVINDAFAP